MGSDDIISSAFPNRPDALGFFDDSRIAEDPKSPYNQSRYAAALGRLVDRLLNKSAVAKGRNSRGKRRLRVRPQDQSNTIRTYLKALEIFSYYSVAQFGRELEPRQITTDVAIAFAKWMAGEGPGPDIRGMYVRAMGPDFVALYGAVQKSCSIYGQASITQIIEQLPAETRSRLVKMRADARQGMDVEEAHKALGKLVRAFRTIMRAPTNAEIRKVDGFWGKREQDPFIYRYAMAPRSSLATGSVATHLCSLSAVWSEMSKPSAPDEPPMAFNPWKGVYADWNWRLRQEKANDVARGAAKCMTTPMARAMINATMGTEIEDRRDAFAISMLLFMGVRAEELAGLLRSDLRDQSGNLSVNVLGKGNKVRNVPIDMIARDALMLFTGKLEEEAKKTTPDEDGVRQPTYGALYCRSLLDPDAPLVPSTFRWGCNSRDLVATDPERRRQELLAGAAEDAKECLDTSGVRAMVQKIAQRARVKVVATGEIRGFTDEERLLIHPHAFRHYFASACKEAGVDIMEVKLLLGHEAISTTEGYIAVPPQVSSACAAGVYQTLYRRGPLTAEQLASAKKTGLSPLEDPTIVEWEPDVASTPAAARVTPLTEVERAAVVTAPVWAYQQEEQLLAYLPYGTTAKRFSADVKRREVEAERAVEETRSIGDAQGYAQAVQVLAEIRARHLWTTFRIGRLSKLPWWAGKANRWKDDDLAPVISYAQAAAENSADGSLIAELRDLYDQFFATKGPTAAAAMVAWLGELLDVVGIQFARAMNDRGDAWIPFDAQAPADARVVREHMVESIVAWLEEHGGAIHATGYKSAKNRGNIALAAMDSLPDWFWVPDPLTDDKLGLSRVERSELRVWITGLQALRPSRMRLEQWIDQMAVRFGTWSRKAREHQDRTGAPWAWASEYQDRAAYMLALEAQDMGEEFDKHFPKVFARVDVPAMARALGPDAKDADIREAITRLLASKGIDVDNPQQAYMTPVMRLRAGSKHMFDPALLTFDDRDTIVHDTETRRWWYERYGSDSECVVRRALRTLWERRKRSARSQAHGLLARHFDLELSALIPCASEIEDRIRKSGWTPPTTVDDTVRVSKVMWAGLTDYVRQQQGASPTEMIPPEVVETFWSTELPDVSTMVETHSPSIVSIVDSSPQAVQTLAQLASEISPPTAPAAEPVPEVRSVNVEVEIKPLEELDAEGWKKLGEQMGEAEEQERRSAEPQDPDEAERELADWKKARKQERAEKLSATRQVQLKAAQVAADQIALTAADEYMGMTIDPQLLWTVVSASDARWLAFSPFRGEASVIEMKFMRQVRDELKRLSPSVWFDTKERMIKFRWKGGKGGLNLYASSALPQDDTFIAIAFWKGREIFSNASPTPRWTDPRPWAPRWPEYPLPSAQDATDPDVSAIPWPSDPVDNPLHSAQFHACMLRYETWKRNGVRPEAAVPPGWQPGERSPLPLRPELPHPIDFAFAIVRSS